ncbi:inactive serine protease 35 [Ctenodactylus gundi]
MGNLLLWLVLLAAGGPLTEGSDTEPDFTWHLRRVPRLVSDRTFRLASPAFEAAARPGGAACGVACQKERPAPSLAELEDALSYETVSENGTRTLTKVRVRGLALEAAADAPRAAAPARRRRQVYGTDSRFSILDRRFVTSFPFSTAVKLSTGCSGALLSPTHVLTAAHCVHDGKDYFRGSRKLRVGLLKTRGKGGGRRRGGGGRRSRRGAPGAPRDGAAAGRGRGAAGRGRGAAAPGGPSFRWTRVKNTYVPKGWAGGEDPGAALDYDYALLELKRPHRTQPMELGISPAVGKIPGGRIHFSGFDDDRAGQLVYRFCGVSDESRDLLYQHCDAEAGSAGSGVYLRLRDPGSKTWKRKIVAVYSGHQWVEDRGERKDYNVAVRITPLKYAQICLWIRGDAADCAYG